MIILRCLTKIILPAALLVFFSCSSPKETKDQTDNYIAFQTVKAFPHDVTAFTQGLVIENGKLYESTGQADSWISEVELATGKQDKKIILDKKYFGEGITLLNNKIYQLTWQNQEGFVYDARSYQKLKTFTYKHEGWGITHDGTHLIVSDGTDRLHFKDTVTLQDDHVVRVKDHGAAVDQLNELEFVDGFVYANQWQTNFILKINPATGEVVGKMNLSLLNIEVEKFNGNPDVLNGIAYEKKTKTFLVTGKNWPILFALRLKDQPDTTPKQ